MKTNARAPDGVNMKNQSVINLIKITKMKNLKTITLTAVTCIMLACSCEKTQTLTELPTITQTGANTFGCYVNGELFVPTEQWIHIFPQGVPNPVISFNDTLLQVEATGLVDPKLEKGPRYWIRMTLYNFKDTGKYYFNNADLIVSFHLNDSCHYTNQGKLKLNGALDITYLDKNLRIASGLFNFQVGIIDTYKENYKCDSIINLTEGRFDIKMN